MTGGSTERMARWCPWHRSPSWPASGRTRPARRDSRLGGAATVVAALIAAAALASGCTTARSALGTTNSGCYLALPTASAAVHHRGHLRGVRLADVDSLRPTGRVYNAATSTGRAVRQVCLVAYTGHFASSQVEKPFGRHQGVLAVVVVEYPHVKLLGTVVLRRVPLNFGHPHIGPV
jgi:hypothetical protein